MTRPVCSVKDRGTHLHRSVQLAEATVRVLVVRQPEDREVELLVGMAEEEDQVVTAEHQAGPQEVTGDPPRGAAEDPTPEEAQVVQEALVAQEVLVAQAAAEMDRRMTRTMEKVEAVAGRRVIRVILGRRLTRC